MISLVTATYGRIDEIRVLLDSLSAQTYQNFELIIVDQNSHTYVQDLVELYPQLNIKYIRSSIKGLSINRNIGLKYCQGNIIAFPDDDCFYSPDVLKHVNQLFSNNNEFAFLYTEVVDPQTKKLFIKSSTKPISRKEIIKYCISYNIFIRKNSQISFDERLGVGTYYGSGEETDYLWAYLSHPDIGLCVPNVYIYHPQNSASSITNHQRTRSYALGFGALFKKEIIKRKNYSYIILFIYYCCRSIGGLLLTKNKKFHYYNLIGRMKGIFTFPIK